jgi:TolB-like protein
VLDFPDHQGNTSELGRLLAEDLSVALVNSGKGFAVMDRENMKFLLKEHELTASGLVDPNKIKELGKFAQVDAIVLGNVTVLSEVLSVTVKVVSVETTQVLAATKVSLTRTKDLNLMLAPGGTPVTAVTPQEKPTPARRLGKDFDAPKATCDFANVSLELMSFKPSGGGVQVLVQATNRSSNHPARIGLNVRSGNKFGAFILDEETGDTFQLADVSGLSFSSAIYGNNADSYQGLRYFAVRATNPNTYGAVGQLNEELDRFTEIEPGQSVMFTLIFRNGSGPRGSIFRLSFEIIVAEISSQTSVNVTLHNALIVGIKP